MQISGFLLFFFDPRNWPLMERPLPLDTFAGGKDGLPNRIFQRGYRNTEIKRYEVASIRSKPCYTVPAPYHTTKTTHLAGLF